ncbi:anti-sigma factor antagonist [Rhodococcus sp. (in: high G+C Gram-positive bacteria)]
MEMPGSAAESPLSLDVDVIEGVVVLRARGEIDVLTAQMFEEALDRAASRLPGSVLIADLSEVAFLASAGLAVLVRCSDDIPDGNRFIVVAHGPTTVRPLELTGLTEVLEVHPSVEAALSTV